MTKEKKNSLEEKETAHLISTMILIAQNFWDKALIIAFCALTIYFYFIFSRKRRHNDVDRMFQSL